jgi:hypothetical protein
MLSLVKKLRLRTRVAVGCVGLVAICAAVLFFNGAHTAAAITASQALMGLFLVYNAAKRDEKQQA